MIGSGHILDMIARMKANRESLRKNDFFKKKNKFFLNKREEDHPEYHTATPEQLIQIRYDIKLENRLYFIRSMVILSLLMLSLGITVWFLF
jgi:hypothetical protein